MIPADGRGQEFPTDSRDHPCVSTEARDYRGPLRLHNLCAVPHTQDGPFRMRVGRPRIEH